MSTVNLFPQFLKVGSYLLRIYRNTPELPVVYLHADGDDIDVIAGQCWDCCTLVCIDGTDWNRDFSPWPASKVFQHGGDFSGGADAYLNHLRKTLIPTAESALGTFHDSRMIAGYSLSGLFALYAMYQCRDFSGAASVSGSLWYDGFADYACTHHPSPGVYYLSLGDHEHLSRNPRIAQVRSCTQRVAAKLEQEAAVCMEMNPGGHFADPTGRLVRGIQSMCRMLPNMRIFQV